MWEGKVRAKLTGPSPDEAWSLLKDFCSLSKWVPTIQTCHRLEGEENQPGCVRFCAGPVNRSDPAQPEGWSKERLIDFDSAGRTYSYEVVETNKGFGRYVARIGVLPDPDAEEGCVLEWSFEADPIRGWTRDGFVAFLAVLARGVAGGVEREAMQAASTKSCQ